MPSQLIRNPTVCLLFWGTNAPLDRRHKFFAAIVVPGHDESVGQPETDMRLIPSPDVSVASARA